MEKVHTKNQGKNKNLDIINSGRLDLKKLSIQSKRDSEMNIGINIDKNQNIIIRLKELKMKKLTQLFVIGTITSFTLIIYFVV